ncbi:thioesterase II family protein [Paenibacillus sp. SI8]|uniref:thioesterase II family protein n=1 Tax=unclassified Paenibacillus TaxID=185978 RepID=UPI00346616A5
MKPNVVYCLAHAGGSSSTFNSWKAYLDESIECIPIEYPGRGKRFNESPYRDIQEAAEDVVMQIHSTVKCRNYVIFGHSMGGLVTYETIRKITERQFIQPMHVFISGKSAPFHAKPPAQCEHILSDENFLNRIIRLGGTTKEVLADKELLRYFLPMMRADFRIVETYQYRRQSEPLDNKVTVLYGNHDQSLLGNIRDWNAVFSKEVNYVEFNGGHFFNQVHEKEIVGRINAVFHTY